MVPETTYRRQCFELSGGTMIPRKIVAVDLTRSKDKRSWKRRYTTGDCNALSSPNQDKLAYPMHHMVPETTRHKQGSKQSNATMIPQMTAAADWHAMRIG